MRAERDRRALILTAEGTKQSAILRPRARGRPRSSRPRVTRKAAVLRAAGRGARRSRRSSARSTRATPTTSCSRTSTCRRCPKLAEGESNKLWIIPSEFTEALKGISEGFFAGAATARRRK